MAKLLKKALIAFFLMFCANQAHATIAYVQSVQNAATSGASTVTATFPSNNTAGCLLVVVAANFASSPSLNTPTDTVGDTFVLVNLYWGQSPIFAYMKTWAVINCKGGANAVTVTGTADSLNLATAEYSGSNITLDQQGIWPCGDTSNTGTVGEIASPPIFNSSANELAVAWGYQVNNTGTYSVNNSYTIRVQGGTAREGTLALADRSVSSLGSYSTTFSGPTGFQYAGSASFSEGGSVLVPPIQQLACGDELEPWHQLGTFTSQDIILNASKAGDYIFVGYRSSSGTPTITDDNSQQRAGWTATCDSQVFGPCSGAIDGDPGTAWISGTTQPHWILVNMQAPRAFHQIQILPNQTNAVATNYTLDVSTDGVTWINGVETSPTFTSGSATLQVWDLSTTYTYQYARINSTAGTTYTSMQLLSIGNAYEWTAIQTSSNYTLWYTVVPQDEPAGDIIGFGNINNDNASRVVEIHGLSGLPTLAASSGSSATMNLSLSGYTSPAYCTATTGCSGSQQWYGTIADLKAQISDFLIFAENVNAWGSNVIPGTTPPPGHAGTDLFPTDLSYLEVWLPGAGTPRKIRHQSQVY